MRVKLALLAVLLCTLAPAIVLAQETGSVSGGVFERNGTPVVGATVKISGPQMPTARQVVTTEAGAYTFPLLIPGSYKIEVEKTGVGKTSRDVEVALAKDTQADFLLGAVTEQVNVSAVLPMID